MLLRFPKEPDEEPPKGTVEKNKNESIAKPVVPEPEPASEPEPEPIFSTGGPMVGLKIVVDENDKKMFIEWEDSHGRPLIWFGYDKYGNKTRYERSPAGIYSQRVMEVNHKRSYRGRTG